MSISSAELFGTKKTLSSAELFGTKKTLSSKELFGGSYLDDVAKAFSAESELAVAGAGTAAALAAGMVQFPLSGAVGASAKYQGGGPKEVYEAQEKLNDLIAPKLSKIDESAVSKLMYPIELLNKGATTAQDYTTEELVKMGVDPETAKNIGATVGTGIEFGGLMLAPKAIGKTKSGIVKIGRDFRELKGVENVLSPVESPRVKTSRELFEKIEPKPEVKTTEELFKEEPKSVAPVEDVKPEAKVAEPPATEPVVTEGPTATHPPEPVVGSGPTGIKKEQISKERAERGLDDVEGLKAPKFDTALEEAKKIVDSGERDPRAMATELAKNPRPLNTVETAILDYDRARIKNDHRANENALEKAIDTGDKVAEAEARQKRVIIEDAYNTNDVAGRASLSRSGESLGAGRMMVNEDYSLANLIQKEKNDTGKPVPENVRSLLKKQSEELESLRKQTADMEAARLKGVEDAALKKITLDVAKERRAQTRKATKETLNVEFDSLVKELNKTLGGQLNVGLDPTAAVIIGKMAKNRVHSGIITVEGIVDSIYTAVKKMGLDISKRDIRDAISGYGKTKELSKDAINAQIRELKRQMRLVSALEDAKKGQSPLRSGLQRDLPSDTVRELTRQVKEEMKKAGVDTEIGAKKWRTQLDSIKKRLENNITDSVKRIKEGTDRPKTEGIKYDLETKVLQSYRDILKWIEDIRAEKPGMSPEQRTRMALKAAERSIANLEKMISTGDVSPKKKVSTTPVTKELKDLRYKRDVLLKQVSDARKNLKKGDAESRKALNDLKSKLNSAENSIGEYRRRLIEKDVSPKSKKLSQVDKSSILAEIREYRDGLRKAYQEMKKEAKPKKTEAELEQKRIDAWHKRNEKQIAELEDKLKKGDFVKKEKKAPLELGKDELDVLYRLEDAKRNYMEGATERKMATRTRGEKVKDFLYELPNVYRTFLTSGDLSAVLNQGGFFATHPIGMLKAAPEMLYAFKSRKGQFVAEEKIRRSPYYHKARQAGLFLSEHGKTSLKNMEEAVMSRWAEKIPGVGASARAYTTFLNVQRFEIFKKRMAELEKYGKVNPRESEVIANLINVGTGRGFAGSKANALVGANTLFFAPRNVISRFQLALGQPLIRSIRKTGWTSQATKIVAKEYGRYLTLIGTVYGLALMGGAEVENDARSTDFGKIKIGNTRIDPLLGMQQIVVIMARIGQGSIKDERGRIRPISSWAGKVPYGAGNVASTIGKFIRSKLAPGPGLALDLAQGEDFLGRPMTPENTAKKFIPIAFNDIYDTMKENGVVGGTALALLSILGLRVSTYDPKDRRK